MIEISDISVIIPVYNAEKFLIQSVQSAETIKNVGEIILIEDGSSDHSLEKCQILEKKFSKVKLLTHPDNKNQGAGASRNLGLKNAKYDLIAFLDADDYFLPHRFEKAIDILKKSQEIDGVYDAVGTIYHSEESKEIFERIYSNYPKSEKWGVITTIINEKEDLFESLIKGNNGHFCTDGILFKKSLLKKIGLFDLDLKLGQDSLFYFKLSYYGKIVPGNIREPVAIRRIHASNRIIKNPNKNYYRNLFERKLFKWVISDISNNKYFTAALKRYIFNYNGIPNKSIIQNKLILLLRIIKTIFEFPYVALKINLIRKTFTSN